MYHRGHSLLYSSLELIPSQPRIRTCPMRQEAAFLGRAQLLDMLLRFSVNQWLSSTEPTLEAPGVGGRH
jgi:hypothetical protein